MIRLSEGVNQEQLMALYADPYIAKVGHDHRIAAPIVHPQVCYCSAWVDNRFAGAFMAIRGAIDWELHALLYRWALPWSRDLGRAFLRWAFSHPINRVTAQIIEGLEMARTYCLRLGFKQEGVKRQACLQNGVFRDVYLLGMLRSEYELCI